MNARKMTVAALAVGAALFCACGAGTAHGAMYSGSLTYSPPWPPDASDGLVVGPESLQWASYPISISWEVSDTGTSPSHPWHYRYTFTIAGSQGALSHLIIEVSDGFSGGDMINLLGASVDSIGTQASGPGNPAMPEALYGIKFDPPADDTFDMTWSFDSNRMPVWGDFYAKCGGGAGVQNYAFNQGFTSDDVDPADAPASGTIGFHILRPDSVIPEPATVVLLALGGLALVRRRRTA